MKIGILAYVNENTAPADLVARRCEELGFESIWLPEHPIMSASFRPPQTKVSEEAYQERTGDWYMRIPDPFVLLTAAAAATTRIRIATGICLVPEHQAITLAKTVATLDYYSGGRLLFGIGAGGIPEVSKIMGVDFRRRWEIAGEYVRAMKELWTAETSRFEGEFVRFPAVKCLPKPRQKPHPPIHIGAGGITRNYLRALKNTVAFGDGWAPLAVAPEQLVKDLKTLRELCAQAGRDFNKIEISIFFPLEQEDSRETLKEYQAAGAHRLVFNLWAPQKSDRVLEDLARRYIMA
ncbi:MAG TPA: TIGR03619 family F420-dependent LLM class oxidoreductase [Candidatus Binataceae bacterium]|jgi:probable F420-dependent oxidoreductase|nr:TIGR03619 family F420-dependent LLM class oxidoreductase [Candidatus Binataceae bacterium]